MIKCRINMANVENNIVMLLLFILSNMHLYYYCYHKNFKNVVNTKWPNRWSEQKIILHAKIRNIYVCVCVCVCVCVYCARAQIHTYIYMNCYLCRSCYSATLLTIDVRRASERIPPFRSTLMRSRLPMFSRRGFKRKEIFSISFAEFLICYAIYSSH